MVTRFTSFLTWLYSDAMIMEGALAAPRLWAGASLVLVYNVLLLVGIAGSGLAMFVHVWRLTRNNDAALVSAGRWRSC